MTHNQKISALFAGLMAGISLPVLIAAGPPQTQALGPVTKTVGCTLRQGAGGYPIPDPACTPGAVNPQLTIDVLRDPHFRTGSVRDHLSTPEEKAQTYRAYGIPHPANNHGSTQTCELDHLVSLELGGADSLDNIWPQCGPVGTVLDKRYFKLKDGVENWLARMVRTGKIPLSEAQHGIASDWTQYLAEMAR